MSCPQIAAFIYAVPGGRAFNDIVAAHVWSGFDGIHPPTIIPFVVFLDMCGQSLLKLLGFTRLREYAIVRNNVFVLRDGHKRQGKQKENRLSHVFYFLLTK